MNKKDAEAHVSEAEDALSLLERESDEWHSLALHAAVALREIYRQVGQEPPQEVAALLSRINENEEEEK